MKNIIFILFTFISVAKLNGQEQTVDTVKKASFNLQEINNFWGKELADNGEFYKVTFPRTDIKLNIDGTSVDPGLAYTSWIAYLPMEDGTRIMGDMVLLDTEIAKVIPFLKEKGLNITAVHNHLLRENPRLIDMHIAGKGDALKLSEIMKEAYSFTSTPVENKISKDA